MTIKYLVLIYIVIGGVVSLVDLVTLKYSNKSTKIKDQASILGVTDKFLTPFLSILAIVLVPFWPINIFFLRRRLKEVKSNATKTL